METASSSEAQLTPLLSNALLHRVERMRLNSIRKLTSRSRGEHLSGKGGSSTEFADYRDYAAGDDMRYIDWNIFSRLQRPYLKLFHREEEQHVVVVIDASSSMNFQGKLDKAKSLAAAFCVMGLIGTERVSVYVINEPKPDCDHVSPCTGRPSMRRVLSFIEGVTGGGEQPPERGIETMINRHRGRGIVVLLSDFLTFGDLRRSFNLLHSAGLEILALQVLAPAEIDPDVTGDMRLVDCENDAMVDITAGGDLLALYQQYRVAFQQSLELMASQRGGRFLAVSSATPVETIVLDQLRRRGWVR